MAPTDKELGESVGAIAPLIAELHRWRREARGDIPNLSRWGKEAALLSRAVGRKGSLGVYGESQIGKSFLISALAATKGRIEIRTPGAAEPVDFLKTLNHEHGQETTGLVSRFAARQPELLGPEKDALTVELLDLEDLIWAFVLGVQQDVESPTPDAIEDARSRIQEVLTAARRGLDTGVEDDPRIGVMSSVDRVCKRMDEDGGCAKLPRDLRGSFRDVVADYLREGKRPSDAVFFPFVSLLWHGHGCEALLRLFHRLYDAVHKLQGFDVVEVAMRDVQAREKEQDSLLTVTVVSQIGGSGQPSIKVYGRSGVGGDHGPCTILRPELAALVSEVMLPVDRGEGSEEDLLSIGDVLDFPGSRAAGKQVPMALLTDPEALNVFLRGKLTRIFQKLVEQQEIGVLCIGVTAKGNVEASKPTQLAIEHWLQQQTSGGLTDPPLLAVFTKCDELLKTTVSHSDGAAQFGSLFKKLDKYNGARHPWMTHWPGFDGEGEPETRVRAFNRCICVFNPRFLKPQDARPDIAHYLAEAVAAREVRPMCENVAWVTGLAETGGDGAFTGNIPMLRRESEARLAKVDRTEILVRKVRRLAGEIESFASEHYKAVGAITPEKRREEEEKAKRVSDHLRRAAAMKFTKQRTSPFALLLAGLSVTPAQMGRALRKASGLEADGQADDYSQAVVQCACDEWRVAAERCDPRDHDSIDKFFKDEERHEVRSFMKRIPTSEPFRARLSRSIERLKLARARSLGSAATSLSQAWNSLVVDWWVPSRKAEHQLDPGFVPTGSLRRHPSAWMLDHWAASVQDASREMVDPVGPPPIGNDIIFRVLENSKKIGALLDGSGSAAGARRSSVEDSKEMGGALDGTP